jgi:hypothetical protein
LDRRIRVDGLVPQADILSDAGKHIRDAGDESVWLP